MIAGTLVLIAAYLVIPRLRRCSAAERHFLWLLAIAASSLIPLAAWLMPSPPRPWLEALSGVLPPALVPFGPHGPDQMVVRASGIETATPPFDVLLRIVWAAGSAMSAAALLHQLSSLRRIARTTTAVDERIGVRAGAAAQRAGLDLTRVDIAMTGALSVPVTWGVLRPRVLLPVSALAWPDELLDASLAHEFAHVGRGDWLIHMAAACARAVFWFNPMFSLACRALRRESERAADDAVLRSGIDAADYARCLVEVMRSMRPQPAPHVSVAMARAVAELSSRVSNVLEPRSNRAAVTGRQGLTAAMAAVAIAYVGTAVSVPVLSAEVRIAPAALPALLRNVLDVSDIQAPPVSHVRLVNAGVRVTPPQVIEYTTPPLYSEDARRAGLEGLVTVRFLIDPDGAVTAARVVRGLGSGLDQNALVAIRHWQFAPAALDGQPVAVEAEVDVEFSLHNEALNELIANDMATQVGPGVVPPRVIQTMRPVASPGARGHVLLDVVLRENGTPRIVRILQSAGPELDDAAVRAFEAWRFSPATKDGRPVKVRMTAEVDIHG